MDLVHIIGVNILEALPLRGYQWNHFGRIALELIKVERVGPAKLKGVRCRIELQRLEQPSKHWANAW